MQKNDERINQLEWGIEKLSEIKNPQGVDRKDILKLAEPTGEMEIEWRIQDCGKGDKGLWARIIPYIDSRAVQDRLDRIIGPENWKDEYVSVSGGILCCLSIFTKNGWISKSDGSHETDIEPLKGAISGALKRAAVKWGIGRDLYDYNFEFADIVEKETPGALYGKTKSGDVFYWKRKNTKTITEQQRRTLADKAKDLGWKNEEVKELLKMLGYNSSAEITQRDYLSILEQLEK